MRLIRIACSACSYSYYIAAGEASVIVVVITTFILFFFTNMKVICRYEMFCPCVLRGRTNRREGKGQKAGNYAFITINWCEEINDSWLCL